MQAKALLRGLSVLVIALWVAGCDSKTAQEHLEAGRQAIDDGEVNAAIIEFKNALQKDSELGDARFELGVLYLDTGRPLDAVVELERAQSLGFDRVRLEAPLLRAKLGTGEAERVDEVIASLEPRRGAGLSPELTAIYGTALVRVGRLGEARDVLEEALDRAPDNLDSQLALAALDLGAGNLALARQRAEEATESTPDDERPWRLLGEIHLALGEPAAALEAFSTAREVSSGNNLLARMGIARAHLAASEPEAAATVLASILDQFPQFPQANYLKALERVQVQDAAGATESVEKVLAVLPEYLPARFLRGLLFFEQGSGARALEDMQRVIARTPENLRARLVASAVHAQEGRVQEAVDVLEEGKSFATESPLLAGYLAALGQVQLRAGNARDGLANLEEAARLQPDAAAIRTQLAVAHLATGGSAEAEAELNQAIDLSESFPRSDALLVLIQLRDGRVDEAMASVERFIERSPDLPLSYNLLGYVHAARDDLTSARSAFEKALELDERFTPARLSLAQLALGDGDRGEARRMLESVLDYAPANSDALERLLRMAIEDRDFEDIRGRLRDAVAERPEALRNVLLLAEAQRTAGDREAAFQTLDAVEGDGNPQLVRLRARLALETGRSSEAIESLRTLRARDPNDARITSELAGALLAANDLDAAARLISSTMSTLAEPPPGLLALNTELHIRRSEFEEAEDSLTRLVEQVGDATIVDLLRGDLNAAQGDLAKAEESYAAALAEAPSSQTVRKLYLVLAGQDKNAEAGRVVSEWLAENPQDFGIRFLLAQQLMSEQRYEEAVTEYERMQQDRPDFVVVMNNLAWLYGELGRPGAIEMARKAHRAAPDAPAIADTLAWLLLQNEESADEAAQLLADAVNAAPEDSEIRYHYAIALERTGRGREAVDQLETALSLGDFESRSQAASMLARLQ